MQNIQIDDDMPDFTEEFIEDKRCHPILPGTLLLLYLLGVASFISHMESIPYFDAFYACFITYSTIGFGDIDIYVSTFKYQNTKLKVIHSNYMIVENILSGKLVQFDDLWKRCACDWLHAAHSLDYNVTRKSDGQKYKLRFL